VLRVNGTREALFAFVQCVVEDNPDALVLMPNPFYQIYEGATLLAGAKPYLLNTTAENGYIPDLDAVPADIWKRWPAPVPVQSGNPAGAIASREYLEHALELADRHDFVIAADECYARSIATRRTGRPAFCRPACRLAARSSNVAPCSIALSKRSSVPGLRSGFVAGDAALMSRFLLYRTYHGSAMAVPTQLASITAWNEDTHAAGNRRLYQEKFERVMPILAPVLNVTLPAGAVLSVARRRRRRRSVHPGFVHFAEPDGSARQLSRARHAGHQSRPRPRAHLTHRKPRAVHCCAERIRFFVEALNRRAAKT